MKEKVFGVGGLLLFYANIILICLTTMWFGSVLVNQSMNVLSRIEYFNNNIDNIIGYAMILLSVVKFISLVYDNVKLRKISLLGILICWVIISWAYYSSSTPNTSYIISIAMIGFCYIQLWRGDYNE